MTDEEENKVTQQLKGEVAELVLKYAAIEGFDPDIVSTAFLMAAMKISHSRCVAIIRSKERDDQIIKNLGGVNEN